MAVMSNLSRRVFGGATQDHEGGPLNPANQATPEALGVGTFGRRVKGPRDAAGGWSFHTQVTAAFGATSTLKFWYSHLPDPDVTVAAHWVDSGITAIAISATGGTFTVKTDSNPEWIKIEVIGVTSGGSLWGYYRAAEGRTV